MHKQKHYKPAGQGKQCRNGLGILKANMFISKGEVENEEMSQ